MVNPLIAAARRPEVRIHAVADLPTVCQRLGGYLRDRGATHLSWHPSWLLVLQAGLRQEPYLLESSEDGRTSGFAALAFVRSWLFGRFLVGLPYLNYGGVLADSPAAARLLIDHAITLADQLDVRYLELRHEQAMDHPALGQSRTDKVHMRLPLPASAGALWEQLSAKVRNQVRKGQKSGFTVDWGGSELLSDFYHVFSHNMRDLGTPVYSRRLFAETLRQFPDQAELGILRTGKKPVAAALLLHGWTVTEVPSASSLRAYNSTCANMLLYWHLLQRSIERGQAWFDFGRSSIDSNTFRFKKQWGAQPFGAHWQYYARIQEVSSMRTDNPKYQRMIRLWQRLPVRITRWLGPPIVRGIP